MQISKIQTVLQLIFLTLAIFSSSSSIIILQLVVNYGIDKATVGKFQAFQSISILISSLLGSYILKLGYKKTMLFGLLIIIIASLLMAIVRNVWAVPVMFALGGFSFTIIKLSLYSTIGLVTDSKQKHTSLFNGVEGAFTMGALLGPLLFSWTIRWSYWSHAFWCIAMLALLAYILLLNTHINESETQESLDKPKLSQMFVLLKYSLVWIFFICVLLASTLQSSFKAWLPTFNTEVFQLPEAQAVLFSSLYFASIASSRFLIGFLQARISWINIQIINLIFAFIITLTVLILTNYQNQYVQEYTILLACCFSLVGLFFGSIYPTICSIILNELPKVFHSAMSGLIVIFSEAGIAVGILTIGLIANNFSIHNAFYFMLLPIGILPFLLIVYHKFSLRFHLEKSS